MIFPGIDLLRAGAALLVLVYHVIRLSHWAAVPETAYPWIFANGWIGVDLFLTISGFVIALTAFQGVAREGTGFRPGFVRRRLARIVPLYVLTCVAFVFLVRPHLLLEPQPQLSFHVLSHAFFVHNLSHHTHGSINGPSWSVALEMQFYLFILIAAPWLARMRPARLLLAALVVAALWRAAVAWGWPDAPPIIRFIYVTQLPGVIDQFALGIALALVLQDPGHRLRAWLLPGWRNFATWAAIAAVLGTGAALWEGTGEYLASKRMVVAWRPLLGGACAAALGAAITFPWAAARVLAPLRYLGQVSYGIYLWHMLVLLVVIERIPPLQGWRLLAYVLVASLVLAAISWHWLEKPALEAAKRRGRAVPAA